MQMKLFSLNQQIALLKVALPTRNQHHNLHKCLLKNIWP